MTALTVARFIILRSWDKQIREDPNIDEYWYHIWITFGVPDEADFDTIKEIAEDDETFSYICGVYEEIYKNVGKR